MCDLIIKTDIILPSNEIDLKNKHWNIHFVIVFLILSSLITMLMGGIEGLLLGGLLFIISLISFVSNAININENDKPRLFIGKHGFRFNHRGMPEIPWNQVKKVELEATSKTNAPNETENTFAKVTITTNNDSLWFPSLSQVESFFLKKSFHYYWPEIAIELTYNQSRVFASLALIRANLIVNKNPDRTLIKALKAYFQPLENTIGFQEQLRNIPIHNDINTDLPKINDVT